MRAALIYNPSAGKRRELRLAMVQAAAAELNAAGHSTTIIPTRGPGTAGNQAEEAIASGHNTVFACGGDGTVNEVMQGVIASRSEVPLGIIPLGTGNVLAHDIRVPNDPAQAVRTQLTREAASVAAGKLTYTINDGSTRSTYFAVTAGVGSDAEMLYRVTAEVKGRWGMFGYLFEGLRVGLLGKWTPFELSFRDETTGQPRTEQVLQIMAVRVTEFGPYLRHMAPGAALHRNDFQLVIYKTRHPYRYFRHALDAWRRVPSNVKGIERTYATVIECREAISHDSVRVEVDGETVGKLPARIEIVPNAIRLFLPPRD